MFQFTNDDVAQAQSGDEAAVMRVLAGMEKKVGSSIARVRSSSAEPDDLRSAAHLALLKAIMSFDTERGVPFPSYAGPIIRAAIAEEVSASRSGPSMPHDLRARIAILESRDMDQDDIDQALVEKGYHDVGGAFNAYHGTQSIDDERPSSGDDEGSDLVVATGDFAGTVTDNIAVRTALKELPEREQQIIVLAFGIDGGTELNDREIGEVIGIDRSRVNRIKKRAISSLHKALQ